MGVCSVRLTRSNERMARAFLISEPECHLADHTALTNHPVAKTATHLSSSSPSSRHQRLGERV